MSVVVTGRYLGGKNVQLKHEPSGSVFLTDAPVDNGGEGLAFSPTDLIGSALGSCIMTTIAIVAERSDIKITTMSMRVEKHMGTEPRRIAKLDLEIHLPRDLEGSSHKEKLERAGNLCPVKQTLHPDTEVVLQYLYDL